LGSVQTTVREIWLIPPPISPFPPEELRHRRRRPEYTMTYLINNATTQFMKTIKMFTTQQAIENPDENATLFNFSYTCALILFRDFGAILVSYLLTYTNLHWR